MGTPGPVFVEFPIDVLYPYELVKREVGAKNEGRGLFNKAVNWYLNNYVDNIFSGAWEPTDFQPLPVQIPLPSTNKIVKCAELLAKAKRPLILMGSQSTLPPTRSEELVRALHRLGIPCHLGGMSRGMLGPNSPLQARQCRRDSLKEADLILLVGSVCDFRLSYGRVLPRKTPVIAVNRNKDQLYRNSDMFWKPAVAVECDVGTFLVELSKTADGHVWDPEWIKTLRKRDQDKEETNAKMAAEDTFTRFNLPIMAIVGNDAAWTQILREQLPVLGTDVCCKQKFTDYHEVAKGYGGAGYQLTRNDKDCIRDVLKEAREHSLTTGKSVLINALIGQAGFRDGSISV